MVAGSMCGLPTEAELQRACGTLYITHGLESTCGLVMFVFFSVVAVKLHARSHLRSPATAFLRFCLYHLYDFCDEFVTTLMTVGQMDKLKLEQRLRFCGNLDKMANAMSALLSALGITRWLSIGNVNGMRYIGYAMTCPLTQLELVVMLAPIIPCYRLAAFTAFSVTFITLTCGYVASLLWMPVWTGDVITFAQSGNIDDLGPTAKFFTVLPAFIGITTLWVIILPYLVFMYTIKGGNKNDDLPQEYRFLVSLVWVTWLCFPFWWIMSWEGNAVITDTKINEIGFTVLNMTAKGLFTLQSFRVGELNDARMAARRGNNNKDSNFRDSDGKRRANTDGSTEGRYVPPILSRASSRKLSASKFVQVLRSYDYEEEDEEESETESEAESDSDRMRRAGVGGKSRDRPRAPEAAPSRHQSRDRTKNLY